MIIFGIDPGLNKTGIGILENKDNKLNCIDYSVIKNKQGIEPVDKIKNLVNKIEDFVLKYKPEYAALEDSFYSVNVKTAISLGVARGAIIATLLSKGVNVHQFTALQIKKAVVGYGKADKNQVKKMVEMQLGITLDGVLNDASDALACAICLGVFLNGKLYDKLY
ncbi:crossover junction endodeoxyribonuclease RuvC [Deferribacter autotrophicus]|uniref:Crossover junction endodeoxyribonuclease RuvC n=1 Tax=Deferribacter autotrophicus TaxID=500465 RepID=A0A5A8F7C2_9BACT|nr:crossover junction endodeoxyribonuclease RuvC [Deferribacter autotrophicus]KAA0258007.1 crossover junction endodeoxyribonuclease RuvC [Deferribacter autotrophicus]